LISEASEGTTLVEVRMWPVGVTTLPVPENPPPSAVFVEMPTVAARTWSATARVAGGSAAVADRARLAATKATRSHAWHFGLPLVRCRVLFSHSVRAVVVLRGITLGDDRF
jgi:hypothetical protein